MQDALEILARRLGDQRKHDRALPRCCIRPMNARWKNQQSPLGLGTREFSHTEYCPDFFVNPFFVGACSSFK
jgi:hypothetical protein